MKAKLWQIPSMSTNCSKGAAVGNEYVQAAGRSRLSHKDPHWGGSLDCRADLS